MVAAAWKSRPFRVMPTALPRTATHSPKTRPRLVDMNQCRFRGEPAGRSVTDSTERSSVANRSAKIRLGCLVRRANGATRSSLLPVSGPSCLRDQGCATNFLAHRAWSAWMSGVFAGLGCPHWARVLQTAGGGHHLSDGRWKRAPLCASY